MLGKNNKICIFSSLNSTWALRERARSGRLEARERYLNKQSKFRTRYTFRARLKPSSIVNKISFQDIIWFRLKKFSVCVCSRKTSPRKRTVITFMGALHPLNPARWCIQTFDGKFKFCGVELFSFPSMGFKLLSYVIWKNIAWAYHQVSFIST